jgi:periplasmic protein TonB
VIGARSILPASLARAAALGGLVTLAWSACISKDEAKKLVEGFEASRPSRPDGPPVMLNRENPVRYPPSLYASRAQGNVTLRIFVDTAGRVHPESTRVVEPSSDPAFDSAAVTGIRDARFSPATRHGTPVAVTILFPVYFRHPQGAPIPGDSVLHRGSDSGGQAAGSGAAMPAVADSGSNGRSGRARADKVVK